MLLHLGLNYIEDSYYIKAFNTILTRHGWRKKLNAEPSSALSQFFELNRNLTS